MCLRSCAVVIYDHSCDPGGADFGGGIWDLFSLGPEQEDRRQMIVHALGPVWEANSVWIIALTAVVQRGRSSRV